MRKDYALLGNMQYFCIKFTHMDENKENVFQDLKVRCAEKGTNITEVCRLANVPRSTPERWKNKNPRTRRTAKKLFEVLERMSTT